MNKKTVSIILILVVIAGIGFYFKTSVSVKEKPIPVATVFMSKAGFSPTELSIKKGEAVEFVNSESKDCPLSDATCNFWPASDLHPSHELYPEFDPREPIGPGESWVFTFDRVGNWGFHDHFKSRSRGVVHVVE